MSKSNLTHCISLAFAPGGSPGKPIPLNAECMKKLDQVPSLVKAALESYGSQVGEPMLLGGVVVIPIEQKPDLIETQAMTLLNDLRLTEIELEANAKLQPPLPHAQALKRPHCVGLLKALTRAHLKSGLDPILEIHGECYSLPHPDPGVYTEPESIEPECKVLRSSVIGLCVPNEDVFVVVLPNCVLLELPRDAYKETKSSLHDKIMEGDAVFEGLAMVVGKVMRALPGGSLVSQRRLQAGRADKEDAQTA